MLTLGLAIRILVFVAGSIIIILTFSSAVSAFVLPRAARSQLNRIVFGLLRRVVNFILRLAKTYQRRDGIMAPCAPWSSDCALEFNLPPMMISKKHKLLTEKSI